RTARESSRARSQSPTSCIRALDAPHPVREQPLALEREHALRMELHALDVELAMAKPHDLAFRGPRAHLEARRERRALDEQRVIACRLERRGEAFEDAASVVLDWRRLAVHEALRAHDTPAERLPHRLMSEADAEDRDGPRNRLNGFERDPRLVRRARTG